MQYLDVHISHLLASPQLPLSFTSAACYVQAHVDMETTGTNVPSLLRLVGRGQGEKECTRMLAGEFTHPRPYITDFLESWTCFSPLAGRNSPERL